MLPYLTSCYGNPHSRTHAYGWESEKAVEKARKVHLAYLASSEFRNCLASFHCQFCPQQIADLIGSDPKEIIFTSGATESNNISVKGVARFYRRSKKHVITSQTVRFKL